MPTDPPSDQQPEDAARSSGEHESSDGDAPTMITPPPRPAVFEQTLATDLNLPRQPQPRSDQTLVTDLNMGRALDERTMATDLNQPTRPTAGVRPSSGTGVRPASGTALTMPMGSGPTRQPSAELMLEGQVIGDFEIGIKLGQGGMGAVFKGRQVSLDRPVAVKVLPSHLSEDRSFIERFQLEARAVAKLTSPYIIQVYGAGESQGLHYFAMEYVVGKDLAVRMKEGLRPTAEEAIQLILQAAKGLAAAGDAGIIHRDIKPHNMMVTDDGHLKIMDFGLVKVAESGQGLTMTGAVMGTVSYFSPEQGRGLRCDHRTDIYALGVVLYELLTGTLPFTGPDATAVIYQHIHSAPRPPLEINPDIPEDLQAVVLKCMQKKADDRYQKAHELVKDLERIAQGLRPIEALKNPELLRSGASLVKGQPFREERRSPLVAILLAVLILGGGAAGYWWYHEQQEREQSTSSVVLPGGGKPPMVVEEDPERQEAVLAIEGQDWARAETLIAPHREGGSEAWKRLDQRLLGGRTQALAQSAKQAFDQGDIQAAAKAVKALEELVPDDGRLSELRAQLASGQNRVDSLLELRKMLQEGQAAVVVDRCDALLASNAGDQAALALRERARGMLALLQAADERLANGAYSTALDIYTKMLADDPNELARKGVSAVDVARGVQTAVEAGEFDLAQSRLDELARLMPDSQALQACQRRLHHGALRHAGRQAVARSDWPVAEQTIATLREDDTASDIANALEQHLREQQALRELERLLASQDLAASQQQLARIEQFTRDPAVLAQARKALADSQLEVSAAAAAQAAQERAIAAEFAALEQALLDKVIDPLQAEERLGELSGQHGAQRPEIPRIQARIADRRAELAAAKLLSSLDAAVVAGDAAAWQELVIDTTLRAALVELAAQPGLVFTHRLQQIERNAEGFSARAVLHNGFAIYPERDITCIYRIERTGASWVISGASFALP